MTGIALDGIGLVSGWGEGTAALPVDARRRAGGRATIPLPRPEYSGDRFRRATRECLMGVRAVDALLRATGLDRAAIAGSETALIYATAGAYGASNRDFIDAVAQSKTLHFPYTAPSAVPAEVAIEFGLTGGYVIFLGGATAMIDGLWQASVLLGQGVCRRALVLGVETFAECEDLYARARWHRPSPLVEAAACALLTRGPRRLIVREASEESALERLVRARVGETLACAPLFALAIAREAGADPAALTGEWRGRRTALHFLDGAVA